MKFQIQTDQIIIYMPTTAWQQTTRQQLETPSFHTFCAVRAKTRDLSEMLVDRRFLEYLSRCLSGEGVPIHFQV